MLRSSTAARDETTDGFSDLPQQPSRRLGRTRPIAALLSAVSCDRTTIRSYMHLLGGSFSRLLLSLVYFVSLTTALGLRDFGFFATSASVGMILARMVAFGYGANMFVIAATRPRLLGRYLAIFGVWLAASLPFCLGLAILVHWVCFADAGKLESYLVIVAVEAVVWRLIDLVAVVNGGRGRYDASAATYNVAFLARALAAFAFLMLADGEVSQWAWAYALANVVALAFATVVLMPRVQLRLRRNTLLLRGKHALALGSAHFISMTQGESDKVLVLALGGEMTAGVFATCIRLLDLTAMPVRAFNILMIRKLLRDPAAMRSARGMVLTEVGIALISTLTFVVIALALWINPDLLGREVAKAAPILPLFWAVPALRNLVEYQAELLYARLRRTTLFFISGALIAVKSLLITLVFSNLKDAEHWGLAMNAVFLAAYVASTIGTYVVPRLHGPRTRQ